ncbi:MAG: riboflavin biosynthesis protein RibF [Myxococcales bacterium]|nr:riboflavin biosynthesis protein RibF [Myxococcales bacterium]
MREVTAPNGAACVIGNFDGVHRGHQAVLEALCELAAARELAPKLLTFEPHPAVTLGRAAPALLTRLPRKAELCRRHCPGLEVVAQPFTTEFALLSPEAFAQQVLRDELDARLVMVGRDFRFGHRRAGGFAELVNLGKALGFDAVGEPLVGDADGVLSSTRVRALLAAGQLDGVRALLGRPHMLSGRVARGAERGRTLGFPTCNLADVAEALPPFGVYAVLVDLESDAGVRRLARGVANVGLRPTITEAKAAPFVEVHLFDFEGDLYGTRLRVHLWAALRPEQRFASLDELGRQIERDARAARDALAAAPSAGGEAGWF